VHHLLFWVMLIDSVQVDVRLVPMLAILYLISHIDRANIGVSKSKMQVLSHTKSGQNAKIEGMVEDLGLDGVQWNIVLSVFFVPYILLEVPSNMLLKKFKRPSYYLGILIVCWGIVMTMMGVVKNFAGLLATRILLGVFECA
jgi:MFS family permease